MYSFAHDTRIRPSRHGNPGPAWAVFLPADRKDKAKSTAKDVDRKIWNTTQPVHLKNVPAGEGEEVVKASNKRTALSRPPVATGTIIVGRDAHAKALIDAGKHPPYTIKDHPIHAGRHPAGYPSGSPTTVVMDLAWICCKPNIMLALKGAASRLPTRQKHLQHRERCAQQISMEMPLSGSWVWAIWKSK